MFGFSVGGCLQLVGGGDAGARLGHLGVEGRRVGLQLGQPLAALSLLLVVLGDAVLGHASEGDALLDQLVVDGLAAGGTLDHGLLGDANLAGPPDDGVLEHRALTNLGLERLGDLQN